VRLGSLAPSQLPFPIGRRLAQFLEAAIVFSFDSPGQTAKSLVSSVSITSDAGLRIGANQGADAIPMRQELNHIAFFERAKC